MEHDIPKWIAESPLASLIVALATSAGAWHYWRGQQSGDAKERADSSGQIAALESWKQFAEASEARAKAAEQRADQFAKERNEAWQKVYELTGELRALKETLAAQTQQISALQDQVRQLKEQLNGK